MLMGLVKKPTIEDYWRTDSSTDTPFFPQNMSRNRYQSILANLHLVDNRKAPAKGRPNFDPLYKVRPILKMVDKNFKKVYSMSRDLALDEGGVPFKGRVSFKVYNPNKPNKYAMKMYEICEASTGYVYHVEVYSGDKDGQKRNKSAKRARTDKTYALDPNATELTETVMRMMDKAGLFDKGHFLYMDNFYNSVELFEELHRRLTYACGTFRANRKGLPKAVTEAKLKGKSGEVVWRRSDTLLALKWSDKNEVKMLSAIHDAKETLAKITYKGEEIWKPTCVVDYNKKKFGVDLNDQFLSYYGCIRRSVKWWRKMFFHVLDMIVTNAWILYRYHHMKRGTIGMLSHSKFVSELADYLVQPGQRGHEGVSPLIAIRGNNNGRLLGRHFPTPIPWKARSGNTKRQRKAAVRPCYVCQQVSEHTNNVKDKHWSTFWCEACGKTLCVQRNCFQVYHTERNYVQAKLQDSGFFELADVESEASRETVETFLASV